MEMQKVLIARVKGGVGDAVAMTRYILNGLSCGVLVLPDEVISYSVEELPVLFEPSRTLTESLVRVGVLDEEHIGKPSTAEPVQGLPVVEIVPLGKEEKTGDTPASDKAAEVLGKLMYPEKAKVPNTSEASAQESGPITGGFKPKGGQAEIKRQTYARLEQYKSKTGLRWAQRVSDATGGRVSPDVIRYGLLEARDIGIDRWKLIAKALDKLEEEMTK